MSTYFLISNMFPSSETPGYGSFVKNTTQSLINNNFYKVHSSLICGKPKSKLLKIVKYIRFYFSIISNFFRKYDFIYIHFPNQAIPILCLLFKIRKKKIILNFHGEDLNYANSGYSHFLGKLTEAFSKKYATSIVVPSSYFQQIVRDRRLVEDDRIIVSASGGINKDIFFGKSAVSIDKILRIGYFGRLEEGKGYQEFLETCKILKNDYPSIKFEATIIGYGSRSKDVYKFVEDNELTKCVRIIDGVAQREMGYYYRSLDLFIFSSSAESLGLTGIEAMACGVPVIGSEVGGIMTYLKAGENGWLVPKNNIESIISKIQLYLSLPYKAKETMRINCIKTGKSYYSDVVSEKLSQDFSRILKLEDK